MRTCEVFNMLTDVGGFRKLESQLHVCVSCKVVGLFALSYITLVCSLVLEKGTKKSVPFLFWCTACETVKILIICSSETPKRTTRGRRKAEPSPPKSPK